MRYLLLTTALVSLFAGGCAREDGPRAVEKPMASTEPVVTADVSDTGSKVYRANCAECHGTDGEGAEKGISLIKGHALHHTAEDFVRRVRDGKGKVMPAFGGRLSEEEIGAVVRHVRDVIQKPYVEEKNAAKK